MIVSYVAEIFHLNDPFYYDAYQIEVTFNPDKTCSVIFDGDLIPAKMTYRYEWDIRQGIYCRNDDTSVMINLASPVGRLAPPGKYSLTDEIDSSGYPIGSGGAFFDNNLGAKYSPADAGTVYWDFMSGTFSIVSVANIDNEFTSLLERTPILTGKLKAISKRRHRDP